jgi:hypothetical protein
MDGTLPAYDATEMLCARPVSIFPVAMPVKTAQLLESAAPCSNLPAREERAMGIEW